MSKSYTDTSDPKPFIWNISLALPMTRSAASLMAACGRHGWKEFCETAQYQTKHLQKHFDFTLRPNAHIHTIRTIEDLFVLPMRENPNPAVYGACLPDFVMCIKLGIDAVELTWYEEEFRQPGSGPVGGALRSWDCDSIVILNPDIILTEDIAKKTMGRPLPRLHISDRKQ